MNSNEEEDGHIFVFFVSLAARISVLSLNWRVSIRVFEKIFEK